MKVAFHKISTKFAKIDDLLFFSQTFKLSTLFSFLALLVVSVKSSSLISEKKVSDHLLLFPIVKIHRRTER